MTAAADDTFAQAWQGEGHRISRSLDAVGAAVVVGRDPEAAAWVALGIAREQAERRRVAIADLVGDLPPLTALVDGEDAHGLSDSFRFGVSLNKIARQVDDAGNLFVLPSGSEPLSVEDITQNERWRRLAAGFKDVGALLLLVARADTPGVQSLVAVTDGMIAAGDLTGAFPDAAPPLAVVGPRPRRQRGAPPEPSGAPQTGTAPVAAAVTAADDDAAAPRPVRRASTAPAPRPWVKWLAFAIVSLFIAGLLLFYGRTARVSDLADDVPPVPDSLRTTIDTSRGTTAPGDTGPNARPMSLRGTPAGAAADDSLIPTEAMNPSDSAAASAFAVYVVGAATPEDASLDRRVRIDELPAATVTPVVLDGDTADRWYRLTVGAYRTRAQADSLLDALRARGVLNPSTSSGHVARLPYALLVEDRVLARDTPRRLQDYRARGIALYPLSRGDGTVGLYAGAFERPEESALLVAQLRRAGARPLLVYRTGRGL